MTSRPDHHDQLWPKMEEALANAQAVTDSELLLMARSMVLEDPLARRFLMKCESLNDNRVYTADDVLGERLCRMAAILAMEATQPEALSLPFPPEHRRALLLILVDLAMRGTPYLWTEEARTALRSLKLPSHTVSPRALPVPAGWHTFHTGIPVGMMDVDGQQHRHLWCDAMILSEAVHGIAVHLICADEIHDEPDLTMAERNAQRLAGERDDRVVITGAVIPYGRTFPDDFNANQRMHAESVLLHLAFLNSPYIPKQQARASRAARREAYRLGLDVPEEEVTFVILRRPEERRERHNDDVAQVEWKHRWIVSGHLRAQWYPSENAHHLIWIAPYLKGPEDAPFIEHVYKVAR